MFFAARKTAISPNTTIHTFISFSEMRKTIDGSSVIVMRNGR